MSNSRAIGLKHVGQAYMSLSTRFLRNVSSHVQKETPPHTHTQSKIIHTRLLQLETQHATKLTFVQMFQHCSTPCAHTSVTPSLLSILARSDDIKTFSSHAYYRSHQSLSFFSRNFISYSYLRVCYCRRHFILALRNCQQYVSPHRRAVTQLAYLYVESIRRELYIHQTSRPNLQRRKLRSGTDQLARLRDN